MTTHDPQSPLDLPIQPTGSGVADLELARELEAVAAGTVPDAENAALSDGEADAITPTETGRDFDESEAQPS